MRSSGWGTRLVAAALAAVLGLGSLPARAETWRVTRGSPAPADGVLFDEAAAVRLAEELREGRAAAAVAEALRAEQAALRAELASLQRELAERVEEARKRELALALAEDRQQRIEAEERRLAAALDRAERVLGQYERLVERLSQRIEALERRQFWMTVLALLGPLGVAGVLLARP